jgi:2-polyprenyl-6-methoxyphenol hydroxylase-like FAD-dependent oxidoreductase
VFNATGDVQKQSLTSEFEILRGDLAQIVTDLALARPGVEVVYGDYVTALAQPGDGGPVRVEFANGRPTGEYDLVVGADGFLSRTRALASGRTAQEDVFDFGGAYVTYFTIPRIADDPPAHSQMFNAPGGRAVVLRPSPAGISCILMIARPGDAALVAAVRQDTTAQKAIFAHHFADIGWQTSRILSGIATTEDFYYQQIAQVRTPRWSFGRIALIGDAAYSPSGLTGMGTTLALYGAYTLAGELANAVREGRSLPDALEAYERVARPYVREMQKIPPGAPGIALPQSRTGVWVLNTIAMLIYRLGIPCLVDLFLSNFGQKEDDKLQMYKWAE